MDTVKDQWRAHRDDTTLPNPFSGHWTYTITEPEEHQRTWETACNYSLYTLQPGTYEVRLTNIGGSTWNPDPAVVTPGFIGNTGPYYASVTIDAIHTRDHYVNRLFTASTSHDEVKAEPTTITLRWYAYQVGDTDRWTHHGEESCRYICKQCGAESPTGIGYANTSEGPLPAPAPDCHNPHLGCSHTSGWQVVDDGYTEKCVDCGHQRDSLENTALKYTRC